MQDLDPHKVQVGIEIGKKVHCVVMSVSASGSV